MALNNIRLKLKYEIDEALFFNSDPDRMFPSEVWDQIVKMKRLKQIQSKYSSMVKKRGDGRVYLYIDRQQISAKNEDALYEKLYQILFGIENSTMNDLFPMWLLWKRDNTPITGKTLQTYQRDFNKYIAPYSISDQKIKDLTAKDFIGLFREWTKTRSMTSRQFNNLKSEINGIFSYAINELEIVENNPARNVDAKMFPIKPVNNDDDVFTEEDRNTILRYLEDDDRPFSLAIQFAFQVTIRIAELKSLKWKNVHGNKIYVCGQLLETTNLKDDGTFEKRRFENVNHVKGNTDKGFRHLPLNSSALAILEKMKKYRTNSPYIFLDGDGNQMETTRFNRWLKRYCERAGVEYHSSHKIRFCVASILYTHGVPITTLQKYLGHTTVQMTMHYLRNVVNDDAVTDIIEKALT